MAAEWICDACKRREPGQHGQYGFEKPRKWFERSDKDGVQTACSRECIEQISKKSGKTAVVLPI